jgi:hypothetical protein
VVLSIAWGQAICGDGTNPTKAPVNAAETYQKTVLPVLAKNCFGCHNEKLNIAGLNLEALRKGSAAVKEKAVWKNVLVKLRD